MKPALPTCLLLVFPPVPAASGVVGILGSTYNGEFEDIKGLNDMLGEHTPLARPALHDGRPWHDAMCTFSVYLTVCKCVMCGAVSS
jgi:hypothetical protein